MLRFILVSLAVALAHVPAHAQSPYQVGRTYGMALPISSPLLAMIETDGTIVVFDIDNPDFNAFYGSEFDAPRQRVVFIADVNGDRRIGSADDTLDPASTTVLRSGLGVDATQLDVDPATGEIYWWEVGQILKAGPQGGGATTLVADNVPEPAALEIDFERGIYFGRGLTSPDLFAGPLDPAATPTTFSALEGAVDDIAIDPVSGDFVWTEYGIDGINGIVSAVVRSTNTFANSTAVVGSLTPSLSNTDRYTGVGVVGTAIAVSWQEIVPNPLFELRIYDTQLGTFETRPGILPTLDIEYFIDPVIAHPESIIVDEGTPAILEVGSLDNQATYQWKKDGIDLANDGRVGGTDTSKLTILPAEPGDTAEYTCLVTNSLGTQQLSNAAIIAVRGNPASDCPADQNFDGMLNAADFTAWIINYNNGCP